MMISYKEFDMRNIIGLCMLFCIIFQMQSANADTLAYVTDSQPRSMWRDAKAGVVTNDFTVFFEGRKSLRFNYTMTRDSTDPQHPNGWAGFGFWLPTTISIAAYSYLTMAIIGPTSSNAELWLAILTKASADTADTVYYYSHYKVPEQVSSTEWVIVNAPLASFDPPINKEILKQVDFHLEPQSGVSTDTGSFYLDDVVFRTEPANHVLGYEKGDTRNILSDIAWSGSATIQVFALNGTYVRTARTASRSHVLFDNSLFPALPNGAYIMKYSDQTLPSKRLLLNR
jgi:hypothetical protein